MQTIGLIGGITPQSTILYYQILNDLASKTFGDMHSCKLIIHSLDFAEIAQLQNECRWDLLEDIMSNAGKSLEAAGAKLILIGANTMHLTIDAIRKNTFIPVIHIAEATATQIQHKNIKKVALLGTKYTMEKTFYKAILLNHSIETIIPDENDRNRIHRIIYQELSKGILLPESKNIYLEVIEKMISKGAEGIILGCTEIPLLIKQEDVSIPTFDTTTIHATEGFNLALKTSIKLFE